MSSSHGNHVPAHKMNDLLAVFPLGAASLLTQPSQPREALLRNLTLQTLFPQPRWATEPQSPTPTSAHVLTPGPLRGDQLWHRLGPKEGGKQHGELCASSRSVPCRNRSWGRGPQPPIRQMGHTGDQAKYPFLPLLSPALPAVPLTPTALPCQLLRKGQAP